MKPILIFLSLSLLLNVNTVFSETRKKTIGDLKSPIITGRVQYVHDGDTIRVKSRAKVHKIRLEGIDAPELTQSFGLESKEYLKSLLDGKKVRFSTSKKDRYKRIVSYITLESTGESINHKMVEQGYAWWYRKYAKNDKELEKLQKQAKLKKRGLWAMPNSIAPWEFRRKK